MKMDVRRYRYFAEYLVFQAFVFVLRAMPVRTAFGIADSVAWLLHRAVPKRLNRESVCRENLRIAFGADLPDAEIDRIIAGMWRHLCRLIAEVVQLPRRLRVENSAEVLDFYQRDQCVAAVLSGRSVLFLGGHFGNWEVSVTTFGVFGFPMNVVARALVNPWLHQWFKRFRESTGNSLISKHGAGRELEKTLERKGFASLLCDQDAGPSGVFVDFFGRPASTFKSIGLLALQFDALVVVGGAWRLPEPAQADARWARFNLTTQDIIDSRDFQGVNGLKELTTRFTKSLEEMIRKAPEQYFWVHRRWKTPPGARRRSGKPWL